ncbi:class I SAM-dependent methyltransferase [Candidatus Nomurabacteria bacterium]|nr:class I SAM-dependent methyltransferase [Candidatus Nomurabacteria bacterium]
MKTHWDNVAAWYDNHLENSNDSYQEKVIAPNLTRILEIKKGQNILDLACGQGYFSRLVKEKGAIVSGVDLSKDLIDLAKQRSTNIEYVVAPAHQTKLKKDYFDTIFTVLAFENIKNIDEVMLEIKRILKKDGKFVLVMLHPAFRIPQHSDWGFDENKSVQYRRIDRYLSETKIDIEQNPFKSKGKSTVTFHRSLQWYMKIFKKNGFVISSIEEWISHKKSQKGKRQIAEDIARKEFPMFLVLELKKF